MPPALGTNWDTVRHCKLCAHHKLALPAGCIEMSPAEQWWQEVKFLLFFSIRGKNTISSCLLSHSLKQYMYRETNVWLMHVKPIMWCLHLKPRSFIIFHARQGHYPYNWLLQGSIDHMIIVDLEVNVQISWRVETFLEDHLIFNKPNSTLEGRVGFSFCLPNQSLLG